MSDLPRQIVVVGASLAGLRTLESLRQLGYDGRLTLIGDEVHLPYDRPPLSKQILTGAWDADKTYLADHARFEELDVRTLLGRSGTGLDLERREVYLDDGSVAGFDAAVVATGAVARRWSGAGCPPGVHLLRTLDDALGVREALLGGGRVVVIGGGFIGTEVASAARQLGLEVTLVMQESVPLEIAVGPVVGEVCARLHEAHGVRLVGGVTVATIDGVERVESVTLGDGTLLPADAVVLGLGAKPATDWLESSGLGLDNGVLCDEYGVADQASQVYAVGDVARWRGVDGRHVRSEHWTNVAEQAHHVARNIMAGPEECAAYVPVPYFWSDQYDIKIQMVGHHDATAELDVAMGSLDQKSFAVTYSVAGRLVGAVGFNAPRQIAGYRRQLRVDAVETHGRTSR